jgi:hypothetical protein
MKPKFVSQRDVFKACVRHLSIRDTDYCLIEGPDAGRPQADIVDNATRLSYLQIVPDANCLIEDYRNAPDYIL